MIPWRVIGVSPLPRGAILVGVLLAGLGGVILMHPAPAPARWSVSGWGSALAASAAPAAARARTGDLSALDQPAPTRLPAASDRPAVAAPTADFRLVAPPSISAAHIDAVLATYHSPAAGSGALFYDLGVQYGIDPAYALAFYINESAAGTKGVARFTHGIGNIRTTVGYADYAGYRSYPTYAAGIADWYKLIKDVYVDSWGLTTPDEILLRYAPWGDNNNPEVYAATVKALVASWQD